MEFFKTHKNLVTAVCAVVSITRRSSFPAPA